MREYYRKHFQFMQFFIKTLQNCDNQSFEEYKKSALMKICLHIMEKLYMLNHLLHDVLSKRKYFISEKFLAKQLILEDYFSRRSSLQKIRWSTLQQDLRACRRQLLSQRAHGMKWGTDLRPISVPPPSPKIFPPPPPLVLKLSTPPPPTNWKWLLLHFSHMANSNKHTFIFLKLL